MTPLLALDSFKGCLTAPEAVDAAASALAGRDVCRMPLSDGGEGFAACLAGCLGGVFRTVSVHDPLGRPIDASYALLEGGRRQRSHPLESGRTGSAQCLIHRYR